MSRRRLSDDERALWSGVTRSIAPLRKPRPLASDDDHAAPVRTAPKPNSPASRHATAAHVPRAAAATAPPPLAPPALAPLGRRFRQRLARGAHALHGRLDLHGLTQAQAHGALLHFLHAAQSRGDKVVLVITGKGAPDGGERGVLRRQVPLWLGLPEFRGYVVGYESAGLGHGGDGAIYIHVRRRR
jgi:DNA-nicking Smr family endonuclease